MVNLMKELLDSCRNMLKTSDHFTLKILTHLLTITLTNLDSLEVVNLSFLRPLPLEVNLIDGEIFNFKYSRLASNKVVLAKSLLLRTPCLTKP